MHRHRAGDRNDYRKGLAIMSNEIKKVAVLGTGVMGGQIAAHLTNANYEVYAFDMDQETAEKGLKAAVKRSDKIFILKMKGSLHFLLEEKEEALETWEHVQNLDPNDEEVRQMLENLE